MSSISELRKMAAEIAENEKTHKAGNTRPSGLISLLRDHPAQHEQTAILNAYKAAK